MKTFGIIAHLKRPHVKKTAVFVMDWLARHNLTFYLGEELAASLGDTQHVKANSSFYRDLDCVISIGGDGTMLLSVRRAGHHGVPVFGINAGSLGFLTEISEDEIASALEHLKDDKYDIDERMVLEAKIEGSENGQFLGLNDVVFDHGDNTRLIKLNLYQNDQFVSPYNADGMIISTPTGSTAYNLASGGPIMHPHLDAIIVSPICPHSLTLRPIIFDENSRLLVKVASTDIDVRMTVDGQVSCILEPGAQVCVCKAPHMVKLIRIKEFSFFEILRTKLHWGARPLTSNND